LQERAHAGFAAVAQAASERVQTAKAGKNLLDRGGEIAAQAVVAKQASIDAADSDRVVARRVELAIVTLDESVAKLKVASVQHNMDPTGHFAKIEAEHKDRVAALRQIAHMLKPASCLVMSPEDRDALAIVQAKVGCAEVLSKTAAALENVKQTTLASVSSVSTPPRQAVVPPTPTLLQGLRETFALQNVKQAANGRIDTAMAGKRLLDDGGEAVVVAKKATLEAADIDRRVAESVESAILKLDDSATKLRMVLPKSLIFSEEASEVINLSLAANLADEHEQRAKAFRQVADMLKEPISSLAMNLAELDAHSFVKAKEHCSFLQCRTTEGFEAVKGLAHAGCMDKEGPMRRRMTACA
jgi:hypothetical protein